MATYEGQEPPIFKGVTSPAIRPPRHTEETRFPETDDMFGPAYGWPEMGLPRPQPVADAQQEQAPQPAPTPQS